jgi:energy-converting hydrogenase Eha subunit E
MIGSWVPGQMNITGWMIHRRAGGNPEHTDLFTAVFAIGLCFIWTAFSWLIALLAFIGMVSSGTDNVTLIILSIVSGLLSFIPLCLIIGFTLKD